MKRITAVLVVAAIAAGASATAGRAAGGVTFFRTPSGNIGCVYSPAASGTPASLRCDIRTGLRPRPAKPRKCDLDWGDSYALQRTGLPILVCHGDTAIDPHAHVLRYGSSWTRSGFQCTSETSGLHCLNPSGHGFFMSRAHSYRF